MKRVGGWWCPDAMSRPDAFLRRAYEAELQAYGGHVCVQAGGHIGIYPFALSENFSRVYTFEPDADNFGCLVRNCTRQHIYATRGVLGDKRGCVGMDKHKSSGGHTVDGAGYCPLYRIDDLGLDACDLIYLDVEGYEMHALRGAMETIAAFKPMIVAEENKKSVWHGFELGDLEKLLAPIGYQIIRRSGEDLVFQCKG